MQILAEQPVTRSNSEPKMITILGATGSIGQSTLEIIDLHRDSYRVNALTANSNWSKLANDARNFSANFVAIADPDQYLNLKNALSGTGTEVAAGEEALIEAANRPADCYMAAIVGAAGLVPSITAAQQGTRVALANKECLVSAGLLFMAEVNASNTELIPVDSEHSAAFQAIDAKFPESIDRLVLTASGGPFRTWPIEKLAKATKTEALNHPNWAMGDKITIDSATMMNKGLELIEAFHLFPVKAEQLGIVIHPESIIHCLVEYKDGSVLAQMSMPDMRTPIAYSLAWPERISAPTGKLDLTRLGSLTFEEPDEKRFPALRLARNVLNDSASLGTVLNAANEIAVDAFLNGEIRYLAIPSIVEETLENAGSHLRLSKTTTLQDIMSIDEEARRMAKQQCLRFCC